MVFIKHSSTIRSLLVGALGLCSSHFAAAGPLQQAEINKIVNDVRVVDSAMATARPAKVRDVIKGKLAVRTGPQSRAELLFQDQTLTRLGAESVFAFTPGTRDLTLDRGTLLLQVPKGLGGAKIRTAAVTAAITGTTIMIENRPGSHVKVVVLEGSLRLSLNDRRGEAVTLTPGKMILLGEKDKRMPQPVSVDLKTLVKSSALIDPVKFKGNSKTKVAPLPSIGIIEQQIVIQEGQKTRGRLAETNLVINGNGGDVIVASKGTISTVNNNPGRASTVLARLEQRDRATTPLVKGDGAPGNSGIARSLAAGNSDNLRKLANNGNNAANRGSASDNGRALGKDNDRGNDDDRGNSGNANGNQGDGNQGNGNQGNGNQGNSNGNQGNGNQGNANGNQGNGNGNQGNGNGAAKAKGKG